MPNDLIVQQTPTPMSLLATAVEKGLDVAQLKDLMDLQERWEAKEARKSFFSAISKFQTIVPELKKTKTAKINSAKGFFQYKYADLGSITSAIKKVTKRMWAFLQVGVCRRGCKNESNLLCKPFRWSYRIKYHGSGIG